MQRSSRPSHLYPLNPKSRPILSAKLLSIWRRILACSSQQLFFATISTYLCVCGNQSLRNRDAIDHLNARIDNRIVL
jgi:hypothetical protein